MTFRDRTEAGRALAARLRDYAGRGDVTVLGLPRGGVPVAAEVATALGAPLDVVVVRKVGVPGRRELAAGAIAGGGVRVTDERVLRCSRVDPAALAAVEAEEAAELLRRERAYRGDRPSPDLTGRVAVLVDDGLATGSTMRAALAWVRSRGAARTVVAVPVASGPAVAQLRREADLVVALDVPEPFGAVGAHYRDFAAPSEDEVCRLLGRGGRAE